MKIVINEKVKQEFLMRYLFVLLLILSFDTFADYKCDIELRRENIKVGQYTVFGFDSGYHSPSEIALFKESDNPEKMSTILFYHTMDTEEGMNELSLSVTRQNVFWGQNQNYNHTKYQNLGTIKLSNTQVKSINFENYLLTVSCEIK